MTDDERDVIRVSEAEEALARQLEALAPLMRELERAEAERDATFARNLRAYLVDGEHPG